MADLNELVENLSKLTVMEAAELSRMLEAKWGVSATAPVAVPDLTVTPTPAPVVDEQTEFQVTLTGAADGKKINVIKEIRTITGLGLKESKELVEAASEKEPKLIRENANGADAQKIKETIEAAGGTVRIA